MTKIAIIGTAGRDNSKIHTRQLFDKMINCTKYMLENVKTPTLISGGAAWADHVAVRLFLEGYTQELILHLPCDFQNGRFVDTGKKDWRTNPGYMANFYHVKFSEIIGIDSLSEIGLAITKGATVTINKGFHNRNTLVANCDYLIALTWSESGYPVGGTLDTWNKSKAQKYHIDLNKL